MKSIFLAALLFNFSCKKSEQTGIITNAKNEIATTVSDYSQAYEKNDARSLAEFYAEDATIIQSYTDPVTGQDNIEQQFKNIFYQSKFSRVEWTVTEAKSDGALLYTHGKYSMMIQPSGLKAVTLNGKFLSVWQKNERGDWKIVCEMRESND